MRASGFTVSLLMVAIAVSCNGERPYLAKGSVESGVAKPVSATAAEPLTLDPRLVSARFDGSDEATMVNPDMDYRFFVVFTNNASQTVTAITGTVSAQSASGSDLLVNHPFRISNLSLTPGTSYRAALEVPIASHLAERGRLHFEVLTVQPAQK